MKHTKQTTATAFLLKTDGTIIGVCPDNGTDFSLAELYKEIGCELIEVAYPIADKNFILIVDEEGALKEDAQLNPLASQLNGGPIFGTAVYCHTSMLK